MEKKYSVYITPTSMFEIFQYDFMVRAFVSGIIIGVIAPLVGTFLVVRRLSLIADTLAHVSLVGVAAGVLLNVSPVGGALMAAVVAAFGIEKLRQSKKLFGESVLALFLSGSLAIAAILLSLSKGSGANITSFLFGSIVTVQNYELWLMGVLGVIAILVIAVFYKEFSAISLDEDLAHVSGIPTRFFNILLVLFTAITTALAMRIVGILLIGALMVIPVVTAAQFGKSFKNTLLWSIGVSLFSVIVGLFLAFWLTISSGGAIVAVAIILFVASFTTNLKFRRSDIR